MRTNEEIDAEIKKGAEFVKEHPHSMFGDDNVRLYNIFLKIIEKVRRGESISSIEDFIADAYEEGSSEQTRAFDVVNWLQGNEDSVY